MKRGWFIALCLAVTTAYVQAQTSLPDSIQQELGIISHDSSYIIKLNNLANNYLKVNPTLSRRIATHATELAPEIKYVKGYARSLVLIGNTYWIEGVYE